MVGIYELISIISGTCTLTLGKAEKWPFLCVAISLIGNALSVKTIITLLLKKFSCKFLFILKYR